MTVGVYCSGTHVINIVKDEDLESHIEYNKIFRPGRLLFVDGKYCCGGLLNDSALKEMIAEWKEKISHFDVEIIAHQRNINKGVEKYE